MPQRIAYLPADDATDAPRDEAANRYDVEVRRAVRMAWIALALGVIVPVVALWAAWSGWNLRQVGHPHGSALLVLGLVVFLVRLALFLPTLG